MHDPIIQQSAARAATSAAVIWAMSTAQYPWPRLLIINEIEAAIIDEVSTFAVNARRAMDALPPPRTRYALTPRRDPPWEGAERGVPVTALREALDRVVHASRLTVNFHVLKPQESTIEYGAALLTSLAIETDRRAVAHVDPLAMADAYLTGPWSDLGGRE